MRLCYFACLLVACPVFGGDVWPEFRGPWGNGESNAVGLPVTWSEQENIAWKTAVHGEGWSSPVIWGEQVWVTSATPDGKQLFAICLDCDTGKVIHDLKVFDVANPREKHKFNTYSSPTPVIEAGRIYVSWGSAGLACLDTETGEVLWSRRDLECNHYRGPGSSPILFGDLLISHFDGYDHQYVVALDKATGDTVWRRQRPTDFGTDNGDKKKAYATPIVIDVGGRQQLISPASMGAFAFDVFTGEEIWRARYEEFSTGNRPVYEQGLVFIGSGFSKGAMLAINPTGQGDVTETHVAWVQTRNMPSKPSPLVIDGLVYCISDKGVASCLDAATGETVWQARVGGNFSSSPLYADGHIYIPSEEGTTTVIAPGREYTVLAENVLDEGCLASPAVVGSAIYLRTRTHLYRIEVGTGDWRVDP